MFLALRNEYETLLAYALQNYRARMNCSLCMTNLMLYLIQHYSLHFLV